MDDGGGGVKATKSEPILITALALLVLSVTEVAVMVTLSPTGAVAGAV
jgi:hypothetical protein